jgi:hypothetical protein
MCPAKWPRCVVERQICVTVHHEPYSQHSRCCIVVKQSAFLRPGYSDPHAGLAAQSGYISSTSAAIEPTDTPHHLPPRLLHGPKVGAHDQRKAAMGDRMRNLVEVSDRDN